LPQLPCPEWKNEQEPPDKLDDLVRAAVAIYEFIRRQNQKKHTLNHGHLKTWHAKLFKGVAPVPYYAGNYRSADQQRPCLNVDVQVAGIPGASFQDVARRMTQFSEQLESATVDTDKFFAAQKSPELRLKAAVQLASVAAGSVIQIHPFLNGNGRIARLAANFFFNRYGFRMPFYVERPSEFAAEYATASQAAMASGDFRPLFQYFILLLAR
jgi:fido (protein-threonine AMPylation protein)